ncbi:hypothetical protein GCM10027515_13630 [Schumannella luteola]|uniref:Putative YigZ family protein n=1 Tax=Schumannella luteola TaxID=472059 RepID=A0A852Y8V5_9MICO|nr:putative YigZ family protein [Schumannella luteola]TPX02927.1 YigZ family protein [Schumannella luteola]
MTSAAPLSVIARDGEHEIEIQRSRFRTTLVRVSDADAAAAVIAEVRRASPEANHHCTAFRIGDVQRSSDDGEPGGTAGVPMLEVLLRRELTEVAAVVTRWFGGVKLGAGGLVRAYSQAVSEAVDAVGVLARIRQTELRFAVPHADAGRLEHALRSGAASGAGGAGGGTGAGVTVLGVDYGRLAAITVRVGDTAAFTAWLAAQTAGAIVPEVLGTVEVDGR